MKLPAPLGLQSVAGVAAWGRSLVAAIGSSWNIEHDPDGRHVFTWTDLSYAATRFSGSGSMTWTVDSADQKSLMWRYVGKDTIELQWTISGSDVGGTASTELRILLPDGLKASHYMNATHWYTDAGTEGIGWVGVLPGDAFIRLYKLASGNWTLTTGDNTATQGQLTLRVE